MPQTSVVFFQDAQGNAPALAWLRTLKAMNRRAYAKCRVRIARLQELGHELRRPEADTLRDGVNELRVRIGHINYRLLYGFHGQGTAVIVHALTKEAAIPDHDITVAIDRLGHFRRDPRQHTYIDGGDT